jgi:hypothetical protein
MRKSYDTLARFLCLSFHLGLSTRNRGEERWINHSDGGCWTVRGRAAEEAAAGRALARREDSGARAKQPGRGDGAVRLGGADAGRGGAEVRLLRLGRAE